jgi:hypothetical protein
MTAVEWLYKNLLENPISNQDIEYNEAVFHNAKEMEKQQGYSVEEVLEIIRQYALEEHLITSSKPDIWFKQYKKK